MELEGNDAIGRFRFANRSVPEDGWGAQAEQLGLKEANSSCRERTGGREALETKEEHDMEGRKRECSD